MHVTFYLAAAAVLNIPSYHPKTTKTLLVLCRQSQDARRQATTTPTSVARTMPDKTPKRGKKFGEKV
jgi:hypothetical protein